MKSIIISDLNVGDDIYEITIMVGLYQFHKKNVLIIQYLCIFSIFEYIIFIS